MPSDHESFEERLNRLVDLGKEYESVLGDMLAQQQNTIKQAEERIGQIQSLPRPRRNEKEESIYGWARGTGSDRPMRKDIVESSDEKWLGKLLMQVNLTEKEAKDIIARVVSRVRATPEKTKEE